MTRLDKVRETGPEGIKAGIAEYLQAKQNQNPDTFMFLRLNSGEVLVKRGSSTHKIQLCPAGTADFMVNQTTYQYHSNSKTETIYYIKYVRVIWLEVKSPTGQQSPEQKAFERTVTAIGSEYYLPESVDDVMEVIPPGIDGG